MTPTKNHKTRLVLIDAHAIIHRAYHALPDFATSDGRPTGALYGLITMLIKLTTDLRPDQIVACYDLPSPTHRHEVYEEYKGTRKKIDPELITQLESSKEIFESFGIPIYSVKGFEADDVLATIVENLSKNPDVEIIIASGDMDTLQLVSGDKVRAFTLRKGITDTVLYDEEAVINRFGFGPKFIPDFKGLSGDQSDNIIGVPGIGEKTATALIQKFGTIEEMFVILKKNRDKFIAEGVKERVINLLTEHEDEALFSKMLATARRDAPINFVLSDKKWEENIDLVKLEALFKSLEFRTLLDRVKTVLKKVGEAGKVGGDNFDEKNGEVGGTNEIKKVAQKIDHAELEKTALALWVVDSNINNPSVEDVLNYAKTDSFEVAKKIILEKLKDGRVKDVYEKIELPLMPIIKQMEERGIRIDTGYLKKLSKNYHGLQKDLETKIWKAAGGEFNINSPKQLSVVIFEKMTLGTTGATRGKKTAGGMRSTKESELEKIRDEHEIISHILEYRELQKLITSYVDTIPEKIGGDGRLHANFVQTGTTTGRISSQDPNLQNIPTKTDLGKKIRDAFIAEDDFSLVAIDYSQIELRIAALLSGDEKLTEIFRSGGDIHTGVASRVFNVSEDSVDKEMRRQAKIINFGILYGMGVNALRVNLGTTREEAKHFYDEYFKNFSTLASYLEKIKAEATKNGYTETFFGRRRYFPGLRSRLPFIRASSERMAINAPFQGTCADIIKLAMIRVGDYLSLEKISNDARLVLTVHDELVYEIRKKSVPDTVKKIKEIMENVIPQNEMAGIPLIVKTSVGQNWGNMEEVIDWVGVDA